MVILLNYPERLKKYIHLCIVSIQDDPFMRLLIPQLGLSISNLGLVAIYVRLS